MKKTFIFAIGLLLGASSVALAASFYSPFPDIKEGDWFASAVQNVYDHGLMSGYQNGNFGPEDDVNRAQLAQVLNRLDERTLQILKEEFGLQYVCPKSNRINCTAGGAPGSACRDQDYLNWVTANCESVDIPE